MATREEKLKLVEDLKKQIEVVKTELEEVKHDKQRRFKSGTLLRTGILLLILSLGLGLTALFWL